MTERESEVTSGRAASPSSFEVIWRAGRPPSEGLHPGFGYRVSHDRGMLIERDVAVTLRDGITIYADVFRPEHRDRPSGAPPVGTLRQAFPDL